MNLETDLEEHFATKFDADTKQWSGLEITSPYNPDISVGQIIHMNLFCNPKNILQINDTEGIQLTNEDVLLLSTRVALNLIDKGVTQQDIVGLIASNTSYALPVCYGVLFSGAAFHTLDPSFDKNDIAHSWKKTTPKVVFCDGQAYKRVKEVKDENGLDYHIFTLNDHLEKVDRVDELFQSHPSEKIFMPSKISSGDQTATILCSSGSTGLSKSVCHSHKFWHHFIQFVHDTCEDIILNLNSLYWFSGCSTMLSCAISGATYLVISSPFTAQQALHLIDKYNVTKAIFPPKNIAAVLYSHDINRKNIKSIKALLSGGGSFPVHTRNRIKKYLSPSAVIAFGYATTEVGLISFSLSEKHPESSGVLAPNVQVKIVDDQGNNLGVGEDGEICVNNGLKWLGYFGDKKATDEVYESDTWYHTGDLGRFDENGYLYIVDRIKEIIKSKNFHVFPTEIEKVIIQLSGIADVCVCGIPDELNVSLPAALVIKCDGSNITEEVIANHVASKMSYYKQLTGGVYFVEEIPRTPSGKHMRKAVTKEAERLYRLRNGM